MKINVIVDPKQSVFAQVAGLTLSKQNLNNFGLVGNKNDENLPSSRLDQVREDAEILAKDVIVDFNLKTHTSAPNRYCETLRRKVKETSEQHHLLFKEMVNRFKVDEKSTSSFSKFVVALDEIFYDGQINWGRIVAAYTFAFQLTKYYVEINYEPDAKALDHYNKNIALFVGKYVANKLGHWVLDQGGWDSFVDFFTDKEGKRRKSPPSCKKIRKSDGLKPTMSLILFTVAVLIGCCKFWQ